MKSNTHLWQEEMLKKNGWYIHFVEDSLFPYGTNIHTHGLPQRFNHLDIQICYKLDRELAYLILYDIVEDIKIGLRYAPAIKYSNVMGYPVEFAEAKEDGRTVLRIILPDKNGEVRGEIKDQWKGCRVYPINN